MVLILYLLHHIASVGYIRGYDAGIVCPLPRLTFPLPLTFPLTFPFPFPHLSFRNDFILDQTNHILGPDTAH